MKKLIFVILAVSVVGSFAPSANAQMMGARLPDGQGFSNTKVDWNKVVEHTAREEQEGKELWDKLQAKEVACENLSDEQFGVLGEYFMGQMAGDSHAAMNAMMIQTHGEEGEEQIHIVMGKRLSGCDASAVFPAGSGGWMPMLNTMNFGFGSLGGFGWIFMILWWVLIIAGIVALIKWLTTQSHDSHGHEKSSLKILKERYAKGEIDRKEFEDKKKDLT
ncbi:MAG: SHOCT domain-containing protein [Candidatus Vogelbacteria bacterium]|nr:SHOCT domain-containing protein [Candidatus Vogelbacteria bacterium]